MGGKKLIKRADGSYSPRGLWDNIRANRGSGKKPTTQMLEQESKIKNENKMGGKRKLMKKAGFPDLSGDGKVTKKDILMGRGVIGKKKKQMGGVKKVAKAALDAATTGVPGAVSKMVTGNTKAATSSAEGPVVSAARAAGAVRLASKRAPKKKQYGGKKPKKKMMGGKQPKAMYEKGGFLSEPSVFDLDND